MTESNQSSSNGWNEVESPTQGTLHDVVTTASNPYAVGGGGYLLVRRDDGWKALLERGPKVDSNSLRGVAVSTDGKHIWFAGDSGVLARYSVENDDSCAGSSRLVDYSRTYDITSTWEDIAITGAAGNERILLYNSSGELLLGENDDGTLSWSESMKPGSGSSLSGFEFVDENMGYACDTSGAIYETTDGGESYETIGAEEAPALNDISATGAENITVVAANGSILQYNGTIWTERYVGDEELTGIDFEQEECIGLICGSNGGMYTLGEDGWVAGGTPVNEQLNSITIGADGSDIAVGTNGTIVER